ncbi:hypothetical protein AO262_19650 [Pseudomonas fluorescens ABAC62]|nr:hypothetical protein AO262_19650 [Pseudomonas fluorescens ABAC62]
MNKIVPDPPRFTPDRKAFDRALRHYLQPPSAPTFSVDPELSFEDALAQIGDLLRCAAATAASSDGSHPMAGATVHLIDMAKTLADRALDCLKPKPGNAA